MTSNTSIITSTTSRKCWRILAAVIGCALLWLGIQQGYRMITHNFEVVDPGRLYRSAQLDPADLEKVIRQHGIRMVVNLRGESTTRSWYLEEREVCRRLQVRLLDLRWSARKLPKPERVTTLLTAYHDGPYPMLIHCAAGADRTGLASALYLIDQKDSPASKAHTQSLNLAHGHWPFYPQWAMDEFLVLFKRSDKSLPVWLAEDYPSIYQSESQESLWKKIFEPWAGKLYWQTGE